jgi:hypothetical protein
VWGANSSNVGDVKTGLSLLSRQGLSQLSHKVLALDADPDSYRLSLPAVIGAIVDVSEGGKSGRCLPPNLPTED